jgi:hypothetical protein
MWNSSIGKTSPNDSAPTWRGRPHDTPKRGPATTGPAWSTLRRKLQGYWNYYCVIGNSEQTGTYAHLEQLPFRCPPVRRGQAKYSGDSTNGCCRSFCRALIGMGVENLRNPTPPNPLANGLDDRPNNREDRGKGRWRSLKSFPTIRRASRVKASHRPVSNHCVSE